MTSRTRAWRPAMVLVAAFLAGFAGGLGTGLVGLGLVLGATGSGGITAETPAPGGPEAPAAATGAAPGAEPGAASASPGATATADDRYLLVGRDALLERPVSGPAWDALVESASADWPAPDLDDRGSAALPHALAAALLYARTGDEEARARVLDALAALQAAPPPDDLLSVARQLGGWVIAADLVDARDDGLEDWLSDLRYRTIGDHPRWHTLYGTAGDTANNYGTFALASLIAVDRFLDDGRGLERDWRIFTGYGQPFGWSFRETSDWDEAYSCVAADQDRPEALPVAINPPGCGPDGRFDGMPVEDAAREGAAPRPHAGYVNEAMQGYAVQAQLLARAGYDAWGANDQQVRRVADYQVRWGIWNAHPTGYYAAWMLNAAYGTDYPAEAPTSSGRMLAWTEWLFP